MGFLLKTVKPTQPRKHLRPADLQSHQTEWSIFLRRNLDLKVYSRDLNKKESSWNNLWTFIQLHFQVKVSTYSPGDHDMSWKWLIHIRVWECRWKTKTKTEQNKEKNSVSIKWYNPPQKHMSPILRNLSFPLNMQWDKNIDILFPVFPYYLRASFRLLECH